MSDWVAEYRDRKPKYERLTHKLNSLLHELLDHEKVHATVEARCKSNESFEQKIERKNYTDPFEQMTDLCAARVIVHSLRDQEMVVQLIKNEFAIDEGKSEDKRAALPANQFGYLSQHFIVRAKAERKALREWSDIGELWAEIQVRTELQHAWAAVEHSLNYKTNVGMPTELQRRLFRLSALFELADEELNAIVLQKEELVRRYTEDIAADHLGIDINLDSLTIYLDQPETIARYAKATNDGGTMLYVRHKPYTSADTKLDRLDLEETERCLRAIQALNVQTIRQLDTILKEVEAVAEEVMRLLHSSFLVRVHGARPSEPIRVYMSLPFVIQMLVITYFIEKADLSEVLPGWPPEKRKAFDYKIRELLHEIKGHSP